jgi:rubrerythrin
MDDSRKKLLDALRQAIAAEYEGYGFYQMAARSTEDPLGRQVFEGLAGEELHHAAYLKTQYRSIGETGKVDSSVTLGRPHVVTAGSPIFSPALKQRIGDAHFEMSALAVGVHLEENAMTFYRARAAEATDVAARAFLLELADWETGHHRALLEQQQELQQAYWERNGFAPF